MPRLPFVPVEVSRLHPQSKCATMEETPNTQGGPMSENDATCPSCGKPARRESEEAANAEVTHCEWCGAEYPVPEED